MDNLPNTGRDKSNDFSSAGAPSRGKGKYKPKGRMLDPVALDEVRALLGNITPSRDMLIEYLHVIQDSEKHLLMVKKFGPLNLVWNGVGTLQVPDAGSKPASVNLARVCLAQRAELLIENFERLYPKLKNERVEWALQPFDDQYGDAFDPFMSLPDDQVDELVPGNLQFLKKPRKVAPGA